MKRPTPMLRRRLFCVVVQTTPTARTVRRVLSPPLTWAQSKLLAQNLTDNWADYIVFADAVANVDLNDYPNLGGTRNLPVRDGGVPADVQRAVEDFLAVYKGRKGRRLAERQYLARRSPHAVASALHCQCGRTVVYHQQNGTIVRHHATAWLTDDGDLTQIDRMCPWSGRTLAALRAWNIGPRTRPTHGGPCRNPWHRSAPSRATMLCPECPANYVGTFKVR